MKTPTQNQMHLKLVCKISILIMMFLFQGGINQIQAQNITLSTQAEVDAFPSVCNCTSITKLTITGSDIVNLDSLYQLTSIGQNNTYHSGLFIRNNPLLQNIDGLSNLQSVVRGIGIGNNSLLQNIDGLSNLQLAGAVTINSNPNLQNIDGLHNLQSLNGGVGIYSNDLLTNIDGLSQLESSRNIYIVNNNSLANIDGLSSLKLTTRFLEIAGNNALKNIDGLSNFDSTGIYLIIAFHDSLQNLDGLTNLKKVGTWLDVQGNDVLENIDGLSNLSSAREVAIHRNPSLTDCCPVYELINGENGKNVDYIYIVNNNTGCDSEVEINTYCEDPDNDGCIGFDDPYPNTPSGDSDSDGIADDCDPVFNIEIWVNNTVAYIEDSLNLNGGNTNALTGKLYDALDKYCSGNVAQALNKLNAFKNQIIAFENSGKISASEAAFLIDAADALIAAINDGTVECESQPLELPENNQITTNEIAFDLGLKVFPNPIREIVNIYFETSEYKTTVVIYDLYGKQMWMKETAAYQNTLQVDLSADQFGSGMYIVSVSNETGTQSQRVVVNR